MKFCLNNRQGTLPKIVSNDETREGLFAKKVGKSWSIKIVVNTKTKVGNAVELVRLTQCITTVMWQVVHLQNIYWM